MQAAEEYVYGSISEYKGPTPTHSDGSPYDYVFKGWDPELGKVTQDVNYVAVYEKVPKKFTISFDTNGAASIEPIQVAYDSLISRPQDPSIAGKTFAGWYLNDVKINLNTFKVKGPITLKAQYYEESYDSVINDVPVRIAVNDLQGKTINNKYNDKPLVILTNNRVIVVPAKLKNDVTVPVIENSDNFISYDVTKGLSFGITDHMYGIYLVVEYSRIIDDDIVNEDKRLGYTEISDSGFTAEFREIYDDSGDSRLYDYPGSVTLTIDLEKMGISLPDASSEMIRNYFAGHNYSQNNVEYLGLAVASDRKSASFTVYSLSPFDIVYKDTKRSRPSGGSSYTAPKTGIQ